MRAAALVLSGLCLLAGAARGQVTASLKVAERQDRRLAPYATARLRLDNAAARAVETVLLRPAGGGPTMKYALTVPPGGTGRRTVALPAIRPVQTYRLTALDAAGEVVAHAKAGVTWPEELVRTNLFVDASYDRWRDERPGWPERLRWEVLVVLAGLVLAGAGALLLPGRWIRPAAVVVVAGGLAAALVLCARRSPGAKAVRMACYELSLWGPGWADEDVFFVVSAARTTRTTLTFWANPSPVYSDLPAAAGEDAVVDLTGQKVELTLRPGQVRIFRGFGGTYLSRGLGLGPYRAEQFDFRLQRPSGRISKTARGTLRLEAEIQSARLLGGLVVNDDFWPLRRRGVRVVAEVPARAPASVWALADVASSEVGDLPPRLARAELTRMLGLWREKYQRAGRAYLVDVRTRRGEPPTVAADIVGVAAVELEWGPSPPATEPGGGVGGAQPGGADSGPSPGPGSGEP